MVSCSFGLDPGLFNCYSKGGKNMDVKHGHDLKGKRLM